MKVNSDKDVSVPGKEALKNCLIMRACFVRSNKTQSDLKIRLVIRNNWRYRVKQPAIKTNSLYNLFNIELHMIKCLKYLMFLF